MSTSRSTDNGDNSNWPFELSIPDLNWSRNKEREAGINKDDTFWMMTRLAELLPGHLRSSDLYISLTTTILFLLDVRGARPSIGKESGVGHNANQQKRNNKKTPKVYLLCCLLWSGCLSRPKDQNFGKKRRQSKLGHVERPKLESRLILCDITLVFEFLFLSCRRLSSQSNQTGPSSRQSIVI